MYWIVTRSVPLPLEIAWLKVEPTTAVPNGLRLF